MQLQFCIPRYFLGCSCLIKGCLDIENTPEVYQIVISKSSKMVGGLCKKIVFLGVYCKAKAMVSHKKVVHEVLLLNDRGQCCNQHIEVVRCVVCLRRLDRSLRLKVLRHIDIWYQLLGCL